jgi:hypothetical protein
VTNGVLSHVYHFDSKAIAEEYAREIGLPMTVLMPGIYMSNFPGSMIRQSPPDNAWTFGMPIPDNSPMPLFDTAADTGKFVKSIVLQGEKALGKSILAATAYVTPAEMLESFKKVYPEAGASATFSEIPHDIYLQILQGMGMPAFAANETLENMRLMSEFGYYGGTSLDESHAILDDELTTWEEHMKNAKAFAGLK